METSRCSKRWPTFAPKVTTCPRLPPSTIRPFPVPMVGLVAHLGTCLNLSVSADKDSFVQGISDFYKDYYSVNTDAYADSYVAQLSGRVLMACYQLQNGLTEINAPSLTRANLQSRLTSALGANHALFSNMPTTGTFS